MAGFRKWMVRIFISLNILLVLFTLIGCLVPFLRPGAFWYVALVGLFFPVLLLGNIFFLIVWLFAKSRWALLSALALVLSWQQIFAFVGFNFTSKKINIVKSSDTIRVLTWNVARWDEHNRKLRGGVSYRPQMIEAIMQQNADVLCLQEFFEPRTDRYFRKNIDTLRKLGYLYHFFSPTSITVNGEFQYGMILLSKYPIVDSAKFSFGKTPHSEGLIFADIKIRERLFRVFTVHMESFRAGRTGYLNRNQLSSIKRAYYYRGTQADMVRKQLDASPHPAVICGNLGDVPNSYSYFTVKGQFRDVFLQKGGGLGATFRYFSPTLRIDYILADRRFKIRQYYRPQVAFSDHYPIVADLEIPSE
jgi:endonuclease/exonuclease/phosphatase family metal-dependent hydrolase